MSIINQVVYLVYRENSDMPIRSNLCAYTSEPDALKTALVYQQDPDMTRNGYFDFGVEAITVNPESIYL